MRTPCGACFCGLRRRGRATSPRGAWHGDIAHGPGAPGLRDGVPVRQGVLLYGPPTAGKDTITAALTELDARYVPFIRLKIGSGRTKGYRMGTPEQLAELEAHGDVIYRND